MDLPIKIEGILYAKDKGEYKYLLIQRVPEDGGFWQPLTEGMHDGETIETCLRRGVLEEVGIEQIRKITDRVWSFSWENKHGEPFIDLVYGVELSSKNQVKLNPDEHSDYKWCSYHEAMQLLGRENNKKAFTKFKLKFDL